MSQHYRTDYAGTEFEQKREINDRKILNDLVPDLTNEGCLVHPSHLDKIPLALNKRRREEWLDTARRDGSDIRLPDLEVRNPDFAIRTVEGLKAVLIEVKDQPQMNQTLSTGIQFKHLRTYIATQHMLQQPVMLLFRDSALQEAGSLVPGKPKLMPYRSSFKDGDKYLWYGDFLFDMEIHEPSCFKRCFNCKPDTEIRWVAQRTRGLAPGDDGGPVMKPLPELMRILRSGRLEKLVSLNPEGLPLWDFVQRESESQGFHPLQVPKDGLVFFSVRQ